MEKCKVIQDYSEKHAYQRPHKQSRASGRWKRGNTVKLKLSPPEMNHIIQKAVCTVIPKNVKSKRNSEPRNAALDKEYIAYGIYCLNIGHSFNDSDSDSNWLLTHDRNVNMKETINIM